MIENYEEVTPPCVNGGFICMPKDDFNKMIEYAAKKGAAEVLNTPEISEIKDILAAFRSAKGTIWSTFWKIITSAIIFSIIAGIAVRINH